ncbi:hypothetical protein [Actinoallomurus iriomotensis]|nr:hypothetical protein [Actinoallomurus iriomotensis]
MTEPVSRTEPPSGAAASFPRSGILTTALTRRGRERFSGTLRLDGGQGGEVVMRDGAVLAASTPVAPGIESLLLRSGRISEADWSEVFTAAAPYGRLAEELVERGLLGTAAVEVLTQTAVFDAIFAIALGGVSSCTARPARPGDLPPLLPAEPGLDTGRIVRETHRRLEVVAGWRPFGLTIHTRPAPAETRRNPVLAPGRAAILATADGRASARDIAFTLGRGLYSVLSDLAILLKDGLIAVDPPGGARSQEESAQVGAVRLDEIPIGELPIGELREDSSPEALLEPAPSAETAAELPRRRRADADAEEDV